MLRIAPARYIAKSTTGRLAFSSARIVAASQDLLHQQPSESVPAIAEEEKVEIEQLASREKYVDPQAPNRGLTWAASQKPRREAMVGPRFEQTNLEFQV